MSNENKFCPKCGEPLTDGSCLVCASKITQESQTTFVVAEGIPSHIKVFDDILKDSKEFPTWQAVMAALWSRIAKEAKGYGPGFYMSNSQWKALIGYKRWITLPKAIRAELVRYVK